MNEQLTLAAIQKLLTQEAQNFSRPLSAKLKTLEPFTHAIREFRRRHASFRLIAVLLNKHGVDVSHDTVQRFCRQVLRERSVNRPRRSLRNVCDVSGVLTEASKPLDVIQQRRHAIESAPFSQVESTDDAKARPHIADSKNL